MAGVVSVVSGRSLIGAAIVLINSRQQGPAVATHPVGVAIANRNSKIR